MNLRSKLGEDADKPTHLFKEPRVGYRMPKGKVEEREGDVSGVEGQGECRYPLAFLLPVMPRYLWSGPW